MKSGTVVLKLNGTTAVFICVCVLQYDGKYFVQCLIVVPSVCIQSIVYINIYEHHFEYYFH